MISWLLLLFTVLCGYLTYDAFRWGNFLKGAPFSAISSMWKGGLSHLPLNEQNEIKERYSSSIFGIFQFQILFLVITIILAVATVRAFLV